MLEFLYSVVIVVCLAGDCDAFIIDDGVTLDDCVERLTIVGEIAPRLIVPEGACIMDSTVPGRFMVQLVASKQR